MFWPIVGVTALATLLILAITALLVARRVRGTLRRIEAIEQQLMPHVEQLQADLEVTQRELARLNGEVIDEPAPDTQPAADASEAGDDAGARGGPHRSMGLER